MLRCALFLEVGEESNRKWGVMLGVDPKRRKEGEGVRKDGVVWNVGDIRMLLWIGKMDSLRSRGMMKKIF